jgi:hypothetical protein
MSSVVITTALVMILTAAGVTIYFANRSREFRKFLAGAFFVSGGIQLYLAAMDVSVPLVGTTFVQTPAVGFFRGSVGLALAGACFYFGFIKTTRSK